MPQADLDKLNDFARHLQQGDWSTFNPLTRDEQREIVAIARRFAQTNHVEEVARARTQRRAAIDETQCLLLSGELLVRAGDILAAASPDMRARAAWEEAKA